jgi:hypothetical protein
MVKTKKYAIVTLKTIFVEIFVVIINQEQISKLTHTVFLTVKPIEYMIFLAYLSILECILRKDKGISFKNPYILFQKISCVRKALYVPIFTTGFHTIGKQK